MLDWWEAALLSVATAGAGGLIDLVTAYFTHRWTTSANRESEERQANRRVGEEQRQVIRQRRRERMQPVVDFLELSKRRFASRTVSTSVAEAVEELPPAAKGEDGLAGVGAVEAQGDWV